MYEWIQGEFVGNADNNLTFLKHDEIDYRGNGLFSGYDSG